MNFAEVLILTLAVMLMGFNMGREWQRVMGHSCTECGENFTQGEICYVCVESKLHPPCPIGEGCLVCTAAIGPDIHYKITYEPKSLIS